MQTMLTQNLQMSISWWEEGPEASLLTSRRTQMRRTCTPLLRTTENTLMLLTCHMIKMLILLCLVLSLNGEYISDFQPWEFWKWKKDTFYDVAHGAFFEDARGLQVVDLGDMNNDKTTDLISISTGWKEIGVHYYIDHELSYQTMFYDMSGCEIVSLAFLPFEF